MITKPTAVLRATHAVLPSGGLVIVDLPSVGLRLAALVPGPPVVELSCEPGTGVDVLVQAARDAALLIPLCHQHLTVRRLTSGSTSSRVAGVSEAPVLVVGVDRTPSNALLATALHEAHLRDARLVVVHTWVALHPAGPS